MLKFFSTLALVLSVMTFSSCHSDSSDNNNGGGSPQNARKVNWSSVPAEFNPEVFEENFQTHGIQKIYVDMFGFDADVEMVYDNSLALGQGYLKLYSVYKPHPEVRGSRGSLTTQVIKNDLILSRSGSYGCSIQVKNQNISELAGVCFVRLQIFLPAGAEIEVYNVKYLITKRFIPMDAETFLKNFKDASFADNKKTAINEYLSSYAGMSKKPQLTADQLGVVIDGFSFNTDQFEALRKLHVYVIDRESLGRMIDKEFMTFDRPEARKICGI